MPVADAGGAAIYYESNGIGEPLVLIPGFASGRWNWRWQSGLASGLRLITFDPRGIGRSSTSNLSGLSLGVFAEDVTRILDELGIESANILGASFGGFVALDLASRFPARVDRLILACTSAGGPGHVSPDIEILRSFARQPNVPLGEQVRMFFRPAFSEAFHDEHPEIVEAVCRAREDNDVAEETYQAQLKAAFSFDVVGQLASIHNETLVITGNDDKLVPMQNSVNLAEKLPNARLEVMAHGSHMFFIEDAAEFNRIVSDFVLG